MGGMRVQMGDVPGHVHSKRRRNSDSPNPRGKCLTGKAATTSYGGERVLHSEMEEALEVPPTGTLEFEGEGDLLPEGLPIVLKVETGWYELPRTHSWCPTRVAWCDQSRVEWDLINGTVVWKVEHGDEEIVYCIYEGYELFGLLATITDEDRRIELRVLQNVPRHTSSTCKCGISAINEPPFGDCSLRYYYKGAVFREELGTHFTIVQNETNCAVLKVNGFAFLAAGYIPIFTLTGFNTPQMAKEWQSQNSTLVMPSGAQFVVVGNCTQQEFIVETDQIGEWGPPEWVVQLEGSKCDLKTKNTVFNYQCHCKFQSVPAEAGIYYLHQPRRTLHFEVLAGVNDLVRPQKDPLIGQHVVKRDHKERVMLTPINSLEEVRLNLTGLNISETVPECAPYQS
ncbi:UNVERIFIED_CONTAM: hypothetical protein K2H54_059492 [Gekko kuhli]